MGCYKKKTRSHQKKDTQICVDWIHKNVCPPEKKEPLNLPDTPLYSPKRKAIAK